MAVRLTSPAADIAAARRQSRSLAGVGHRPWSLPSRPWLMGQSWVDLLFAHWRVDAELLSTVVPPQLPLDVIDGSAWVGVTPFEVRALRLRRLPPAPFLSDFAELNVRTYVTVGGRPGIYFLSLDAASRLAVASARRAYRFPYFLARMSIERRNNVIRYRSHRADIDGPPARFEADYEPQGAIFNAAPDSLVWALVERYCAYTLDDEQDVLRAEIHHRPWLLRCATAAIAENSMTTPFGIQLEGEPLLHFAPRQDVLIWPHQTVRD